ncbi:hypothetical protein RchiOBHm_Chr7g0219411 [Rosa chinensis]|uniref:Uncharacterized protein n=1 Tax=Rosa chinensis TaxID=74649 RepID=A0A2P6PCI3_ROSCH|nr:hypothetical protein RchiOBHm_Chr7g0219411 [Rosa chinensis]
MRLLALEGAENTFSSFRFHLNLCCFCSSFGAFNAAGHMCLSVLEDSLMFRKSNENETDWWIIFSLSVFFLLHANQPKDSRQKRVGMILQLLFLCRLFTIILTLYTSLGLWFNFFFFH